MAKYVIHQGFWKEMIIQICPKSSDRCSYKHDAEGDLIDKSRM